MSLPTKYLFLVGRALLGLFYVLQAFAHFSHTEVLAAWAAAQGVPMPTAAVLVSGVLLLIGGLSIGLGIAPRVGITALVIFFIPTTLWMHNFWSLDDAAEAQAQMAHFYKNMALLGSTLVLAAIPRPWLASVTWRPSTDVPGGVMPDSAEASA